MIAWKVRGERCGSRRGEGLGRFGGRHGGQGFRGFRRGMWELGLGLLGIALHLGTPVYPSAIIPSYISNTVPASSTSAQRHLRVRAFLLDRQTVGGGRRAQRSFHGLGRVSLQLLCEGFGGRHWFWGGSSGAVF